MNVLVTGFPGVGKSAIAHELKRRGYNAYDPETMRGFTHLVDRTTGKRIHQPVPVPRGWYDSVGMQVWDQIKVRELLSSNKDIFICSFVHNQQDFYDLFDYIFVLTLDDIELEQRLLGRPGVRIGKAPEELADILLVRRDFEARTLARGAVELNAKAATPELVNTILTTIHDRTHTQG